jgi:hypothetical protein
MTTAALIGSVATVGIMVAAITVLTVMGKPVDNLFLILGSLVIPVITALLTSRKLDSHNVQLTDVATKVNGKMSSLIAARSALEDQVRSLGGTPVTLAPNIPLPAPAPDDDPGKHAAPGPVSGDSNNG